MVKFTFLIAPFEASYYTQTVEKTRLYITKISKIAAKVVFPTFNYFCKVFFSKGLQRQRLIGSTVAGFNHAKTITKACDVG